MGRRRGLELGDLRPKPQILLHGRAVAPDECGEILRQLNAAGGVDAPPASIILGLLMIFQECLCPAHVSVSAGLGQALRYGRVLRHHHSARAPLDLDLARPDLEFRAASKAQAVGRAVSPRPLGILRAPAGVSGSAARIARRDGRTAVADVIVLVGRLQA